MTATTTFSPTTKTPNWLRIAALVGIVWYAFGLMQFWLGYSMDTAAAVAAGALTPAHAAAIDATPLVVWISFALASGAGLVGSVLLLRGAPLAMRVFAVSLAAAAAYYLWVYAISGNGAARPAEEMIIAAVVLAVTAGFVALSRRFG